MAPRFIPTQVANIPQNQPNCHPLRVLITLDGIGSRMSVANNATINPKVAGGCGGFSANPRNQSSTCPPRNRKGRIGTSNTTHIRGRVRNNSRMIYSTPQETSTVANSLPWNLMVFQCPFSHVSYTQGLDAVHDQIGIIDRPQVITE